MLTLKSIDPNFAYAIIDELLRSYIFERDDSFCQICGCEGQVIHHILFRSHGGKNIAFNLILLCTICHNRQHGLNNKQPVQDSALIRMVKNNEKRLRERLV